jgi:hypothetical protein
MKFSILIVTFLVTVFSNAHAAEPVRLMAGGPAAAKRIEAIKSDLDKAVGVPVETKITQFDLAMRALADGLIDGLFCPPLDQTFSAAEKRGMPKQNPDDYQYFAVTDVTLSYGVHPNNPLNKALTREQITDILSGKIKTWETINGQKEPLIVVMPKNYLASMKAITQFYIKSDSSPVVEYVSTQEGLLKSMQKNPNQLGFFSTTEGSPAFKPKFFLSEARHQLFLLMKKKVRPEVQKTFDYLKAHVDAFKE